jgi:hypothetical protein
LYGNRFGCSSFGLAIDALAIQSPPVGPKPDMNGNGSKIEIFKPFGEAFDLMKNFDATAFAFGN